MDEQRDANGLENTVGEVQDLTPSFLLAQLRRHRRRQRSARESPPQLPKTLKGKEARFADDPLLTTMKFFSDEQLRDGTDFIYIGIDTGKSGAIGYLYPSKLEITTAIDIPTIKSKRLSKTKTGNTRYQTLYDNATIWQIVQCWLPYNNRIVVVIEETQPRELDTGCTGHAMGYGFGLWPLFLYSHGFTVEVILPVTWKQRMGLLKRDKEWSRLMAQRLWPNAPLFRKCDEGRAEALLIAECVRRRRNG